MTYEMADFQKDETKLRAKAKKGTITNEEFFKEIKRLHKRATESIVIEDSKMLLDTPYGYKQISTIEDDVAYLYDGAVVQLTPEEIDEISGDTVEEETNAGQVYEAGTSAGAKKAWDTRGRGRKAGDKPINPYPKSHSLHDDAEKNPNKYGKHQDSHVADYDIKNEEEQDFLNKQAKSIYDKGKSQPEGNKQKELETNKEERAKGETHNDLTLQKKWLNTPEDVEKATDEEIFALANGSQMSNADKLEAGTDIDYYKKYMDGLRQSMKADLFGSGSSDLGDPEDDPDDTRPIGADGQRLGKSNEEWEKEGYDVEIQRQNGIIAVTKNGEDVWFSQSHEENVEMFGEDWDNWDSQLILNYLDGGGALQEFESKESKASEGRYLIFGGNDNSYFEVKETTDDLELAKAIANDASAEEITVSQNSTIPERGELKGKILDYNTGEVIYSAESKANEEGLDWTTPHTEDKNCQHPDCVGARAEDILFNNFVVPRGGGMKCNHCGKYWSEEPENTFTSAQALYQPIVQDLLHHARTHGIESKANEEFKEDEHPRKDDGKFTSKGSGSSSSNGDDKEEDIDDGHTEEENKKYYDEITQNTLDTLNRSKVNGFPFFSYIGKPKEIYKDGKGGVVLFGMKRNPNSIRKIDIKYDEGRDTYSVSFTSNRNKPKGEYHDIYFDQLSDLIVGKSGLGVESKASEGYADRKSDLNKAWKSWKRGLKNHPDENTYNDWFEFAKDNGATDEEADDTWDSQNPRDDFLANESITKNQLYVLKRIVRNQDIDEPHAYSLGINDEFPNELRELIFLGLVNTKMNGDLLVTPEGYALATDDELDQQRIDMFNSKAREARIHLQQDVKKKWLERCETCGDIRSSHTAGIDHSFKVDATGVEFVDKGNVFENSILIKSGSQPKRYSKEYISQQIQYEAQKWWHDNYSKKHGRKDFREMTIVEKKRVFLAYLESVVGFGAKLPDYIPTKKGKSYDEDIMSIYETVKRNANEVRKVLMEAKQVRFNNPDPKFWWNADEMRTGMVLNEFKRSGLEWYSVNSAGQLYNVLKDEAELVAGENKPVKEMSDDELISAREYVYGTYRHNGYMRVLEAEIKNRGIGNPNFKNDWKDETRDDKSVENDKRSEKDLEEITNEGITEDITKFIEDPFTLYDKYKKGKGNDEIDKSLNLKGGEMYEDIHEAKPNTLIRYANPRKLPNGKTIMDRVRTSHPQVLERKANEWVEQEFVYNWDCPKCGYEDRAFVKGSDLEPFSKQVEQHYVNSHGYTPEEAKGWNPKTQLYDQSPIDEIWQHHMESVQISGTPDEHMIQDWESKASEDVKDEDWFKKYQRNVDSDKIKISDLWKDEEESKTGEVYPNYNTIPHPSDENCPTNSDGLCICDTCDIDELIFNYKLDKFEHGNGNAQCKTCRKMKGNMPLAKESKANESNGFDEYEKDYLHRKRAKIFTDAKSWWDSEDRSKFGEKMLIPTAVYLNKSWDQHDDFGQMEIESMFDNIAYEEKWWGESKASEGLDPYDDWIHRNFDMFYPEDSPFGACNICHWSPSKLEEDALSGSSLYKIMGDHLEKEHGMKYNGESKANEGGFGSGKRGHSAWMKDIEFGGNYKKCPLCNINTNFSGGKCEICGNSFAGEKKKANEMSDDEWMNKIEQLANKTGVKTIAVQNFLISVGSNGSVGNALANLDMDTGLYKWNSRTRNAIQKGIMIYFDKVKKYDSPPTFEDKYPNTLW